MAAIEILTTESEQVRETWQARALCRDGTGSATPLFFSEELQDIAAAKAFCQECPVKGQCLDTATERREPWGVWGGELFANGKILARKRRRGRPPKVAPAEPADPIAAARSA